MSLGALWPKATFDISAILAAAGMIERNLGWTPWESFETGLSRTVDWYLANEWWWRPIRDGAYSGERPGRLVAAQ